ncbi:hypothetical protein [Vampirovibrio chlorellavorus]|uniref:hypothetical protein n=1 Tax=Vampirovibrio chlorellavorus TaxID=758823 RepID=UPI0026ECAB2D|nr:hypothetical protein [Vampirovibrio chlorellavorus]
MPEKKMPAYALLLMASLVPLVLGSGILIFQAQARALLQAIGLDPLWIGTVLVGTGLIDIALAAFLKSRIQ